MKYGAIKVGVRNMNSNVRPKVYLEKRFTDEWVIVTPYGEVLNEHKEVIVFRSSQMIQAKAMLKAVRSNY